MAENDLLTRLLDAGMTFTTLTQARAEELVRDLVRAGAVQAEQAQEGVDELLARSRRNSERLIGAVRSEIDDRLGHLDLATRADLDGLVQRFADVAAALFSQLTADRGSAPTASPAGGTAVGKGTAATRAPARKAATSKKASTVTKSAKKATAKKSTAKKAAAKKAPAKKAPAKKSAKKAPAKKSTAKKATAKKATGRKAPAKKATGSGSSSR